MIRRNTFQIHVTAQILLLALFFLFGILCNGLMAQAMDTLQVEKKVDSLIDFALQRLRSQQYTVGLPAALEASHIAEYTLGKKNVRYATAINWLGVIYYKLKEVEKAEHCYIEAIEWRSKTVGKKHLDYGKSLYNLGMLCFNRGEYARAEPLFLETCEITAALVGKEHRDYAFVLAPLAATYTETSRYAAAESVYLTISEIYSNISGKTHPEYAVALFRLANLYVAEGKYIDAEPLFIEAMEIQAKATSREHFNYAAFVDALATFYSTIGNYQKAFPLYEEVAAIREKDGGKMQQPYIAALNNVASTYSRLNNFKKAESLYKEALELANTVLGKQNSDYAALLNNLSDLYYYKKDYTGAEALLLQSRAIQEEGLNKSRPLYVKTLHNLSAVYAAMDKDELATTLCEEAVSIRLKTLGKSHPDYGISIFRLSLLYRSAGRLAESEAFLIEGNEILRNTLEYSTSGISENQMLPYLITFEKDIAQVYSAAVLNNSPKIVQASFDNALFLNGFLLDNRRYLARYMEVADSVTKASFDRWQSYHQLLAQEYMKPIQERKNMEELETNAELLEKKLISQLPALDEARRVPRWQDVRSQLTAGTAAIEFIHFNFLRKFSTDTISYAALVLLPGDTSPHLILLCEESVLQKRLEQNKDIAYWTGGSASLYQLLWQPLEHLLKGVHTIYYAPTGLIYNLNLDAIATDPQGTTCLLDQYKLVRLGSTRQLAKPAPRPSASVSNEVLLMGGIRYDAESTEILESNRANGLLARGAAPSKVSVFDRLEQVDDLAYLPGTLSEVEFIKKHIVSPLRATVFTGFAGSEEAFKYSILPGKPSPRIVHIATHGFSNIQAQSPLSKAYLEKENISLSAKTHPLVQSGLYLAGANHARHTGKPLQEGMEDGILTAYEVSTMSLENTDLVVLSACNTGLGAQFGNEGVFGLQRAFKIAGIKYLILSLWQVPDAATEELMSLFYTNLFDKKMEIPTAFRLAQRAMKQRYKDPEMWAGFVLIE